jgi:hypothetical protein
MVEVRVRQCISNHRVATLLVISAAAGARFVMEYRQKQWRAVYLKSQYFSFWGISAV